MINIKNLVKTHFDAIFALGIELHSYLYITEEKDFLNIKEGIDTVIDRDFENGVTLQFICFDNGVGGLTSTIPCNLRFNGVNVNDNAPVVNLHFSTFFRGEKIENKTSVTSSDFSLVINHNNSDN